MASISRIALLIVFALYWGGLTFYTGFVVRISHDVLSDPIDGGLITQRVTDLLQLLGVVTVVVMAWNSVAVLRESRGFGYALMGCAALLACSLAGLFIVHEQLDAIIDVENFEILDRAAFEMGHRRYNQLTTVQWLAALAYLPIAVFAWRTIDMKSGRRANS